MFGAQCTNRVATRQLKELSQCFYGEVLLLMGNNATRASPSPQWYMVAYRLQWVEGWSGGKSGVIHTI